MLLSGNVRDVSITGPRIQAMVVAPLAADVFIHTWSTVEHTTPTWWRSQSDTTEPEAKVPMVDESELIRIFRPRRIVVAPAKDFSTGQHPGDTMLRHPWFPSVTSMWFGVHAAWELMEQQEFADQCDYDFVLRWRFDLLPSRLLSSDDLTPDLLVAGSNLYANLSIPSDTAAIGPRAIMKTYVGLYGRLPELFEEFEIASPWVDFFPEAVLAFHLEQQQVAWDEIRCGLRLHRPGGREVVVATDEPWIRFEHFDYRRIAGRLQSGTEGDMTKYLIRNLEKAGCPEPQAVADVLVPHGRPSSLIVLRREALLIGATRTALNSHSDRRTRVGDRVYRQWWVNSFKTSDLNQRAFLLAGSGPWIAGSDVFHRLARRCLGSAHRILEVGRRWIRAR